MIALAMGLAMPHAAGATTLQQALVAAYGDNPTLTGARAQLRATDEQSAIARAAGRPTLGASVGYTQGIDNLRKFQSFNKQFSAGAQLSVPIYQGGRVRNAVKAADARVDSGRQSLRSSEGGVLVDTVTAYMDVLRDRAIVGLNENNVKVLQTNLEASSDQFQAGTLTRTDVAQSRARLEDGRAQLTTARSNLVNSEENYRRVVGLAPDALDQPPPLPVLPDSPDKAEDIAVANNPDIAAAIASVKAAHLDVATARASRMPSLSASANNSYIRDTAGADSIYTGGATGIQGDSTYAGLSLSVPLYQGGLPSAQIRQAQDFEQAAIETETATERQVVANARAAFSSYEASQEVIVSSQEALKANDLALEGVHAEQTAGLRQVLDVLNAEQEKLGSQVTLVTAQHDAYVAAFNLLNTMGYVDYKHLGLEGGALYDPTMNYRHAKNALSDWHENPKPQPIAKPTYGPQVVTENPPVTPGAN
ncbi:TolC family outer membrane protein [Sphingomonas abietis]|uniref:TolC family outer membrane protein n=1 Tax=Sphingomonas abietis TaxID=3012344 RepID=A0ABY7NRS6_9SPHN|nr:TolC family outer membrane protein [Sphingomonas abietis]WBO24205.1 TolC family outer membrane protein [Sphingomonas abietis]